MHLQCSALQVEKALARLVELYVCFGFCLSSRTTCVGFQGRQLSIKMAALRLIARRKVHAAACNVHLFV